MALTHFAFGPAGAFVGSGDMVQCLQGNPTSEGIAPSASNQTTTQVASTEPVVLCRVSTDTAVYVSFGTAADATTTTTRYFMPAGSVDYFVVAAADKGAVVTI